MIQKIQIRCFQSIEKADIELGKLTVVVGPTDTGKSAFIRAVRAVVENRRGDSFVTTGNDGASVGIVTDKVNVIWAKPKKKGAEYYVDKKKSTLEKALEAIGLAPLDIGRAYKILPNFQAQIGQPFLLGESDSVKSKVLGEITNANILFLAGSSIKRKISEISTTLSVRQQDHAVLENERASFPKETLEALETNVGTTKAHFVVLEKTLKYLDDLKVIETRLSDAVKELNVLNESYAKMKPLVEQLPNVELIIQWNGYKDRLIDFDRQIKKLLADAKVFHKQSLLEQSLPILDDIETRIIDLGKLNNYVRALDEADKARKQVNGLELEKQIHQLTKQINEFDMCPLCERPLYAAVGC